MNRSIPESTAAFANKYVEGAIGRSGKKIRVNGLQAKWAQILNKHRDPNLESNSLHEKDTDNGGHNQAKLTAALAARRRGTHEKFTAAIDKGTTLQMKKRG